MKGVVCLALAMIGVAAGARAQDPSRTEPADGTIEQLVATALERSPELRAARWRATPPLG